MQQESTYKSIPALAAYIDRIGAEELNFRRFMVKIHKGNYYVERAIIVIDSEDFTISCSVKEFEPTKEEVDSIRLALRGEKFPVAIGADSIEGLKKELGARWIAEDVFELWDRRTGKIRMVQQRLKFEDGGKAYLPWTLFSDGRWRRMEPDAKLPFWKPREKKAARVMIHEGAKAARFVEWLIRDESSAARAARAAHPWTEELQDYEHWGIIGGALAPHRADFDELHHEKPIEAVYVCDNDWPGRSVLQEVSRHYSNSLKGVIFDGRWPLAWDLADAFPEKMFTKSELGTRFKGPTLKALMIPATRATELIPNPAEKGRPIAVMRRQFKEEWMHSVQPEAFVHVDFPNRILTTTEFDTLVSPFSDLNETARLLKKDLANKSFSLHYLPTQKSGLFGSREKGRFINTHCPTAVKYENGSEAPWIDFMENLLPNPGDLEEAFRWCATLIERPEVKMLYGMLLISETQGVGKTTLGEKILTPLVGESNVSFPSENDIVDSNYNYWLAHKRLAVVNEIYAGSSAKAYNRLKSVITDRFLMVNKKYQSIYEVENWIHVLACSNSSRALQLSHDDRRWFVPEVTEKIRPREYWPQFNDWLGNGGLGIIRRWAKEWLLDHAPVTPGDRAPDSAAKRSMIEDSLSPGMAMVADLLDELKLRYPAQSIFVTDGMLVEFIKDNLYEGRQSDRLEKPLTLRRLAKAKGWFVGEERVHIGSWGGGLARARLIATDAETARRLPSRLEHEGKKPIDIKNLRINL